MQPFLSAKDGGGGGEDRENMPTLNSFWTFDLRSFVIVGSSSSNEFTARAVACGNLAPIFDSIWVSGVLLRRSGGRSWACIFDIPGRKLRVLSPVSAVHVGKDGKLSYYTNVKRKSRFGSAIYVPKLDINQDMIPI